MSNQSKMGILAIAIVIPLLSFGVCVIDGEADRVSTITRDFQTNKKMDTVKLVMIKLVIMDNK